MQIECVLPQITLGLRTPKWTKHDPSETISSPEGSKPLAAFNVGAVLGCPRHGLAAKGT